MYWFDQSRSWQSGPLDVTCVCQEIVEKLMTSPSILWKKFMTSTPSSYIWSNFYLKQLTAGHYSKPRRPAQPRIWSTSSSRVHTQGAESRAADCVCKWPTLLLCCKRGRERAAAALLCSTCKRRDTRVLNRKIFSIKEMKYWNDFQY